MRQNLQRRWQVRLTDQWLGGTVDFETTPPWIAVLHADSSCVEQSQALAQRLQQQGVITVAVGHQVTLMTQACLSRGWDFALLGEAAMAVPELVDRLSSHSDYSELRHDYRLRLQRAEPYQVKDPDRLPSVDFSSDELAAYPFALPVPGRPLRRWGYVQTLWGCPYDCRHCSGQVRKSNGRRLRLRSVERVIEDIRLLQEAGAEALVFEDDTLFCHKPHLLKLCHAMKQQRLTLPWVANARPDELCRQSVAAAASSGAVLLKLGIESGSFEQLLQLGKTRQPEQWLDASRQGVRMLHDYGIAAQGLMLVGLPGETPAMRRQTRQLIQELPLDYLQLQRFTPYADVALLADNHPANRYHYPLIETDAKSASPAIELQRLYRDFYFRPSWFLRHLRKCWRWYLRPSHWRRLLNYCGFVMRAKRSSSQSSVSLAGPSV